MFGNLEEGDILVTFCSHTYGWRNGHTGMVVDAQKGLTLESVVMGEPSCIQSLEKWRKYPSFIVLRLQGEGRKERQAIAQHALEKMQGIPYGFWSDFLEHFGLEELVADTDCSHLIWQVYKEFGYDLDSDDGIFVTPKDIAMSEHLEVVQMYGIDMNEIIERGE